MCAYILEELSGIIAEWLLANSTPHMCGCGFDQDDCLAMACAML